MTGTMLQEFTASKPAAARWLAIGLCCLLSACAGTQSRNTDPEGDPWEGFNRKMHSFNMSVDKVARPIAVGYDKVMPDPLQRGVGNFFRNLNYPVTVLNQLLQGKFKESGESTKRFLLNSTFGLLGFFDLASREGMPDHDEDLGQTLAGWGWSDSRYLVMPIFGPTTARDFLGRGFYGYFHPVTYVAREHNNYWPMGIDLLQRRAALLPRDQDLFDSYDPYVFVRDAWRQNREYLIHDGEPPEPDYESYLDELED